MGQPDHCHHAVHLINELVQTAQVTASHFVAGAVKVRGAAAATSGPNLKKKKKTFLSVWHFQPKFRPLALPQERDGFGGIMGRRGRGDCTMGGPSGLQEVTYAVPADKCGLVIGKGK